MAADLTFCTVAYVMRSLLREDRLRVVLRTLLKYVSVVPVGAKAISDAIENFASDFEDEVQLRAMWQNDLSSSTGFGDKGMKRQANSTSEEQLSAS